MALKQTTLWIEESLHDEIRSASFYSGLTIKDIVTTAIRHHLKKMKKDRPETPSFFEQGGE